MPSPMMQQFYEIKNQYPGDILFFRLGDFYEMFQEDAQLAAPILGLILTARKNSLDGTIPMCGVPYHSAQNYIKKLIQAGYSVALCEQQGNPKQSKGLVKRQVIKVITPGTALLDHDSLEPSYIASLYQDKQNIYLALAHIVTGEFNTGVYSQIEAKNVLLSYGVKEIILSGQQNFDYLLKDLSVKIVRESRWEFQLNRAQEVLEKHFRIKSLQAYGFELLDSRLIPAGALLAYLTYTQQEDLQHIHRLSPANTSEYMYLDIQTVRNLELFHLQNPSNKGKSLYQAINRTANPMGARLLRQWLLKPLLKLEQIEVRQKDISSYKQNPQLRNLTRQLLTQIADIEKIIARISNNLAGPRDLVLIRQSLILAKELFASNLCSYTKQADQALSQAENLITELQSALREEVPVLVREGGFVAKGYRSDIDELLSLAQGGKEYLLAMQSKEQKRTGISSLKIRYNAVFGYYIEISKAHKAISLPDEYIKKQTLVNAERYITPELKDFEEKILVSEAELLLKEQEVWEYLRQKVLAHLTQLIQISQSIAYIDSLQGLASLAEEYNYIQPEINLSQEIHILEGRHPVLEQIIPEYIANSCHLYQPGHSFMLITGPNMGGKSTYIRQTALIVLLAHIGSFVPAKSAQIGLIDRIFTRIGASDNMGQGQSTFMVEMLEVANILNNATSSSLIILDEVGRGTATWDGMSIAYALIHYIHDKLKTRTLFATHYHELLCLENRLSGVVNYQVKIQEELDSIIFLHRIQSGGADRSYGLAIAKRAGFPEEVLSLAKQTLVEYEKKAKLNAVDSQAEPLQASSSSAEIWQTKYQALYSKIQNLDLNNLTPLQALTTLQDLQTIPDED